MIWKRIAAWRPSLSVAGAATASSWHCSWQANSKSSQQLWMHVQSIKSVPATHH